MLSKRLRRTVSFAPLLTANLVAALAIGPQPAAAESGGHARQAYEKHTRAGHGYVGRAYWGRPYVGRARGPWAARGTTLPYGPEYGFLRNVPANAIVGPGYTFVPGVGILGASCDLPTSACPNAYRDIR
jgi:hypothetical protein